VIWICSLTLLTYFLLSGIKVVVEYQALQHLTESSAIQVSRSLLFQTDVSKRDICRSVELPVDANLVRCEISPKSVEIGISRTVQALGQTFEIRADSRIGYGFYSQNGL
jgi:hypothetical protein